ncbi:MAG: NAD(P)/FAD-dependent oxidoreductase [Chlamydiales bacterium]|nr:NAD(P)/FAD-dependent oxidoreductase [Chlamydiales bacterium]
MKKTHVIIGGGAAGFFSALSCASDSRVIILEKTRQLLAKVRISGGGRCNATHHCFDAAELVKNYPRGNKALRGPFTRFQPRDTIAWFESRGVPLKVEEDGRMFPVTDNSETIIDCLMAEAKKLGVEIRTESNVKDVTPTPEGFDILLASGETLPCHSILLATGGTRHGFDLATKLGHTIVPPVPSLFTFNVPDSPLLDLAGISVEGAECVIEGTTLRQRGPVLITHWGFSGPAVLKLSAWGARILHDLDYKATVTIRWLGDFTDSQVLEVLQETKAKHGARSVQGASPFAAIPRNLWQRLAGFDGPWAQLSKQELARITQRLTRDSYQIQGKTTYKSEFVTCGGVALDEVNFTTMESKKCPGLYFAGEVLDIDGVTGGFNFQAAWTTGYIAGNAMSA